MRKLGAALFIALMFCGAARGWRHGAHQVNIMAEGDSITQSYTINSIVINSYARLFSPPNGFTLTNNALSGSTLASVTARLAADNAFIAAGQVNVYSSLTGANDLGTYPGATDAIAAADYTAAIFSLAASAHAAGWNKICVGTITSTGIPAEIARRAIVNANLRAAVGNQIDCVIDFAADPILGTDGSCQESPTYWADNGSGRDCTHPSQLGQTSIMLPIATAVWDAF